MLDEYNGDGEKSSLELKGIIFIFESNTRRRGYIGDGHKMTTYHRRSLSQHRAKRFVVVAVAMVFSITFNMILAPVWSADSASIARGGRLFDNWILENKDRPPSEIHPKFKIYRTSMHNIETSWRCVSCHGWDYQGRAEQGTGVIRDTKGSEASELASILSDGNHRYGNMLSERDFVDLAAYIRADIASYVDTGPISIPGDATREVKLYSTICANCHGASGHRITSIIPLGNFAKLYPRETMHKILNGHPGVWMPPFRFLKASRLIDLFAYVQSLPEKNLSASIARGGRLYDHWQRETDARTPTARHPAYPKEATNADVPAVNWRCKECHGWDYKGVDGVYGKGTHRTGIKGIRALAGSEPQEVIELLMDKNHRYRGTRWFQTPLDLQDLIDLANFVSYGQIDMDDYIDPSTGTAKGDSERHKEEFNVLCATCHGKGGGKLATGKDIGDVARQNPWEALHKIRNGHPNEAMPALHILDMTLIVDILAYTQTLP
jgi:mono/diheme cytochrome c family protein